MASPTPRPHPPPPLPFLSCVRAYAFPSPSFIYARTECTIRTYVQFDSTSTVLFLFHLEVPLLYERSSAVRSPSIFPSSFSSFVLSSFVSFFSFVSASSSSCTHLPLFVRLLVRTPSPCPLHIQRCSIASLYVRTHCMHYVVYCLRRTVLAA